MKRQKPKPKNKPQIPELPTEPPVGQREPLQCCWLLLKRALLWPQLKMSPFGWGSLQPPQMTLLTGLPDLTAAVFSLVRQQHLPNP